MTETSYPARASVLASCQTRRSKGTGRFSTTMRTRRLPGDAMIAFVVVGMRDAHEVDQRLTVAQSFRDAPELTIVRADDDRIGKREHLIDRLHHQARNMRDAVQNIIAIRADQLRELDVFVVELQLIALADQTLDHLHHRAL